MFFSNTSRRNYITVFIVLLLIFMLVGCGEKKSNTVIETEKAIEAIGDVSSLIESIELINHAENCYAILTETEKAQVSNRMLLVKAKEDYDKLLEVNCYCPFGLKWGASLSELENKCTEVITSPYARPKVAPISLTSVIYDEYVSLTFENEEKNLRLEDISVDLRKPIAMQEKNEEQFRAKNYELSFVVRDMDEIYGKHSFDPSFGNAFRWHTDYVEVLLYSSADMFDKTTGKARLSFFLTPEGKEYFCK